MSERKIPTVSIDRAARYLVDDIEIDPEAIADFYDELPHAHKRPIENLHVHVSAAGVRDGELYTFGQLFEPYEHGDWQRYLPELDHAVGPEATCCVTYLGSIIVATEGSKLGTEQRVNQNITHEVTHYAQNNALGYEFGIVNAAKGLALVAATHLTATADSARLHDTQIANPLRAISNRLHQFAYDDREYERDARAHEDANIQITRLGWIDIPHDIDDYFVGDSFLATLQRRGRRKRHGERSITPTSMR